MSAIPKNFFSSHLEINCYPNFHHTQHTTFIILLKIAIKIERLTLLININSLIIINYSWNFLYGRFSLVCIQCLYVCYSAPYLSSYNNFQWLLTSLLPSCLLFVCACVCVHVCMHVWAVSMHRCPHWMWEPDVNLGYHISHAVYLVLWDRVSPIRQGWRLWSNFKQSTHI